MHRQLWLCILCAAIVFLFYYSWVEYTQTFVDVLRRKMLVEMSLFEKFLYLSGERSLGGENNKNLTIENISPLHGSMNIDEMGDRRAIVTFLCGGTTDLVTQYSKTLRAFAYSLRKIGYVGEILILHTPEFPLTTIQSSLTQFHLTTLQVPRVSIGYEGHRYELMMTKLHIWSLVQYTQVMYYDVDMIFLQNPITAYTLCGNVTSLCAVLDQGIEQFQIGLVVPADQYFNAGLLVLVPDVVLYQKLMDRVNEARDYPYVEQDLLNKVFQGKWKALPIGYNYMHSYRMKIIPKHVIAIHEKLSMLQKHFTYSKYLWNQPFRRRK